MLEDGNQLDGLSYLFMSHLYIFKDAGSAHIRANSIQRDATIGSVMAVMVILARIRAERSIVFHQGISRGSGSHRPQIFDDGLTICG
jgi:hypothetical protein